MAASIDWWLDFNSSVLLDLLLNDTPLLGNESASAAGVWDDVVVTPSYWCLLLLVFPTCTVFGNVLVCLSVYQEKALHTVTNYFISSLAIADIMVAILVMPLAVYVEVCVNFSLSLSIPPNPSLIGFITSTRCAWRTTYCTLCLKKVIHFMFDNNFGKCGSIFNILSPVNS